MAATKFARLMRRAEDSRKWNTVAGQIRSLSGSHQALGRSRTARDGLSGEGATQKQMSTLKTTCVARTMSRAPSIRNHRGDETREP